VRSGSRNVAASEVGSGGPTEAKQSRTEADRGTAKGFFTNESGEPAYVALGYVHYNFCRIQRRLDRPTMEAGLTARVLV